MLFAVTMHRANWTTDVDGAVRRPCPRSQVFGHIWTSAQPPQCRQRRWVAQWLRRSGRGMRHAPAAFSDDHVNHADDMRCAHDPLSTRCDAVSASATRGSIGSWRTVVSGQYPQHPQGVFHTHVLATRAMAKSAFFSSDIVFNEFERCECASRLRATLSSLRDDESCAMQNSGLDGVGVQLRRIMEQFRLLTELQSKWVDFDTAGKEMYLDQVRRVQSLKVALIVFKVITGGRAALQLPQMRSFTERLGVYITRCKLSDDPGAKAMIHQLNIGYLNAGLDFNAWHGGCATT